MWGPERLSKLSQVLQFLVINETSLYKECCNGGRKKRFWSKSRFTSQLSAITSFVSLGIGVPDLSSVCQTQMSLILASNYSVPILQKRSLEASTQYIFLKLGKVWWGGGLVKMKVCFSKWWVGYLEKSKTTIKLSFLNSVDQLLFFIVVYVGRSEW